MTSRVATRRKYVTHTVALPGPAQASAMRHARALQART